MLTTLTLRRNRVVSYPLGRHCNVLARGWEPSPLRGACEYPGGIALQSLKHSPGRPFRYPIPRRQPRASLTTPPPGGHKKTRDGKTRPAPLPRSAGLNRRTSMRSLRHEPQASGKTETWSTMPASTTCQPADRLKLVCIVLGEAHLIDVLT